MPNLNVLTLGSDELWENGVLFLRCYLTRRMSDALVHIYQIFQSTGLLVIEIRVLFLPMLLK